MAFFGLFKTEEEKKEERRKTRLKRRLSRAESEEEQKKILKRDQRLQQRLQKIKNRGEDPEQIYSGGVITDIFDTLNVMQYGITGMMKGKSFSEGVETRESFSKKDALGQYGVPGMITGTLLDMTVDPFTYISPTSVVKSLPYADEGIQGLSNTFKNSKLGRKMVEEFTYGMGADPEFQKLMKKTDVSRHVGIRNVVKMTEDLTDIPNTKAKNLLDIEELTDDAGEFLRTVVKRKPLKKIKKLGVFNDEQFGAIKRAWTKLDDLGKQAVDAGLLKKGKFEENLGKYIKQDYLKNYRKGDIVWGFSPRGVKGVKPRKVAISKEAMKELERIENPAALFLKSSVDLINDIEETKLLNKTAKQFTADGVDEFVDGFKRLPNNKTRLRGLANKVVPEPIYKVIQNITRPKTAAEKTIAKMVGKWKFGKVVLNPATHGRNVLSNLVLNSWEGLSPHRVDIYGEAAKELAKYRKGEPTKWIKEILPKGFDTNTFAAQELQELLIGNKGKIGGGLKTLKKFQKSLSSLYGEEENWAKVAQYIFQRQNGRTADEAWEIAQRATFNYAQVSPFVRKMRSSVWGYPFITFTAKATPQALKTMAKHPARVSYIGKIKNAIENQANLQELKKERKSEPSWIKDGFYIKLPFKDKKGRSAYFDMTYVIPFGDLISGQIFDRPPTIFNLFNQLATNEDFYGDKIFKESDPAQKKMGDVMRHLSKFGLPTPIAQQVPGGYRKDGTQRPGQLARSIMLEKDPKKASSQARTLQQEMLRNIGLKIQPIDLETQEWWSQYEQKKAVNTLLRESGYAREYKTTYIPNE